MLTNNFLTPRVFMGKNCVIENANVFASMGSKCLIVTSKSGAVKSGALEDVCRVLDGQGISYKVFNKIDKVLNYLKINGIEDSEDI